MGRTISKSNLENRKKLTFLNVEVSKAKRTKNGTQRTLNTIKGRRLNLERNVVTTLVGNIKGSLIRTLVQQEQYIHSNITLKQNHDKITFDNYLKFINKQLQEISKIREDEFITLLLQTQREKSTLKEALKKQTNPTEFLNNTIEIILDAFQNSFKNIQNARNIYASSFKDTANNRFFDQLFDYIQKNQISDFCDKLLTPIDNIISAALGLTAQSSSQTLSSCALKIIKQSNNIDMNNFIEQLIQSINNNDIELLNHSDLQATKKGLVEFFNLLKSQDSNFSKASGAKLKKDILSTRFAEWVLFSSAKSAKSQLNKTLGNLPQVTIDLKEHTGSQRIANYFYKNQTNTRTADNIFRFKVKEGKNSSELVIDLGISIKFYHGQANQVKNAKQNQLLKISTGGRGNLEQFIQTTFSQAIYGPNSLKELNRKQEMYNYIVFISQLKNDGRDGSVGPKADFMNFVKQRYFLRLISTGGNIGNNILTNQDLASIVVINGVPISILRLLNDSDSINNAIKIDFSKHPFYYKNEWAGPDNKNMFSAVRRSHQTHEQIRNTYFSATLHLDKLLNNIINKSNNALKYY